VTVVRDELPGEVGEEVALARAVATEHAHALAEQDLGAERRHDAGERQFVDHHRALPRPAATQADAHGLLPRSLARRGRVVPLELCVRRPESARERIGDL